MHPRKTNKSASAKKEDAHDSAAAPDLIVTDVYRTYGAGEAAVEVLKGVSFTAHRGESLAVLGPSGSGKSTLLNLVGLLDRPDAGSIVLDGVELTTVPERDAAAFRRDRIGFVFQDHHLLPQCTALENVLTPLLADASSVGDPTPAVQLLERVGLADKMNAFPDQLSGGQRQRVAIARALVRNPAVLLCDEPTGNLDRTAGLQVVELFLELVREQNMLLIMVTHNKEAAGLLERRLRLRDGRLHEDDQ